MSRAKPKTRLQEHAKKVIRSFEGKPFDAGQVHSEWPNHASPRMRPNPRGVVGLLRNLHAQGFIERCEEKETKAAILGQQYVVVLWREVKLDGKS